MIKKLTIYTAAILTIISLCIPLLTVTALAADGGVKQVSVSVDTPKINPGDTANITITVVAGSDTDAWTGTITVTSPGGPHTKSISGTGSESTWAVFPGTFTNSPNTNTVGTYTISVNANIAGQTAVTGTGSFEVKTWYMTVSSSPIVKNGSVTITINTADADWDGVVTIEEPTAGGSDTSTYTFGAGQNGDQATGAFPAGWTGTANTAVAGVYTVTFDEGTAVGDDDSITFDVQDASPHVGTGFTSTTYACAGCHRAHAGAAGAKLLKGSTQLGLCNSCHDGTGASTNVVDGRYLGNTEGTENAGLRGGGFTNAYMDPDINGSVSSAAISSKHTVGGSENPVAWGSGARDGSQDDEGEQFTAPLQCGNCHNPHGNDSYRLLRPQPTGLSTDATGVDVTVANTLELTKIYTTSYDSNNYRDMGEYPAGVLSLMSDWCGQCHERYVAGAGAGSTDSGDTVFAYSHMTDGLGGECLKCHVAHGTSATMAGNAASATITWPDNYSPAWQGSEDSYSRLLHINNRGVCMQCHDTSELTGN